MPRKYKRVILAIRGDTQSGHSGGLVNPDTQIPEIDFDQKGRRVIDGYRRPELRPVQRRLWSWHEWGRGEIKKLAGKDEIIFLELGDLTQGSIFKDNLAEAELHSQVCISRFTMIPWLDMPNVKKCRIAKGTGVHVWGNGSTETLLTAWLSADYPKKNIRITDHWLFDLDGYVIDIAHHGPGPGVRNWTRGNALDLYIKSMLRNSLDRNEKHSDMVLRGHTHDFTYGFAKHQVGATIYRSEGYIIPPMCFIGSHAQKVVKSPDRMNIGMMALEIIDGKLLDTHTFIKEIDLRTKEVL